MMSSTKRCRERPEQNDYVGRTQTTEKKIARSLALCAALQVKFLQQLSQFTTLILRETRCRMITLVPTTKLPEAYQITTA
uniref:Uncharacterized protein n=1 Tax=Ascaris lumbricoides TaxID=6252 RepID=A0A0M3I8Z6_ASCLU